MFNIQGIEPYYKDDHFLLYRGDCLEVLKSVPDESFDLIFADPPYHLSSDGFTCHAGHRVSVNKGEWDRSAGIEEDFEFNLRWITACRRVLKRNGSIWISGTLHSIFQCGYALQLTGFKLLNDIAWFKPNAPPNLSGRYFAHSHETLLWARKFKNSRHTFNYRFVKEADWGGDFLKRPGKQMRSVWAINTPNSKEKIFGKHPTQKPLMLLIRIIEASSNKGDLVLDPFSGSSTTGLACYLAGRKFLGIEIEKSYLDLSVKRFEQVLERKPLRPMRVSRPEMPQTPRQKELF